MHWCPCVLRTLLFGAIAHVYRGWWASFSAHFWTSGICFYVYHVGTATIRTVGRRFEYVDNHQNYRSRSGTCCRVNQFFSVLMDAAVVACPFPPLSLVVKYNQLFSEMRNVRACFYDVTTRMLRFCTARQLSTDLESLENSCRQENLRLVTRSHIFVFCRDSFQCSCMRTVARLFLRVSSISAHGSGRDHHSSGRCV